MSYTYYLQTMISLLVIVGILYAASKFLKRMKIGQTSSQMKIVDRLPMGTGIGLYIVDVRGEEFLFSVTNKEVSLVKQL